MTYLCFRGRMKWRQWRQCCISDDRRRCGGSVGSDVVDFASVLSRHRGTTKNAEYRSGSKMLLPCWDVGHCMQTSVRYCGDWPASNCTLRRWVYWTLSGTSSQWSSECRSRDKPWSYLWVLETTGAPAFNTRCNLSVITFGALANKVFQSSTRDDTNAQLSFILSVKFHLNGQTDRHQGRQSRIYKTAGSLELIQDDAFSFKTEQKCATTETIG